VKFELQAQERDGQKGRSTSRRLRRLGRVPAIVYGAGKDPSPISLEHEILVHQMEQQGFFTSILTLNVGKESNAVVVKEVQRHPVRPQILHLDFQRIVEDEEITLNVPIRFVGEEAARGVKEQGGVIEHVITDVEISCLPKHLPESIELDVSGMGLNEILHLSDIMLPEGVTSVALAHGQDQAVVSCVPPRREEVDEEVVAEGEGEGEVPVGEEAAAADEEAPKTDEPAAED
jgi:large subunit ribosomal protein L25